MPQKVHNDLMSNVDWNGAVWMTAAACNAGSCVQVACAGGMVGVRDSKRPDGPVLVYTPDEWLTFLAGAKKGDFDSLVG